MIRFHQTFGAHAGRVVDSQQPHVTFGRQPTCDVAFDAQCDLDASGVHAEVRWESGQYHLVDIGSRNGTWLNGQRIQTAVLSTGDEIEFGLGGPRVRVEIRHFEGTPQSQGPAATPAPYAFGAGEVTGPMVPARPDQATGAATPVPPIAGNPIDTSAATVLAAGRDRLVDATPRMGSAQSGSQPFGAPGTPRPFAPAPPTPLASPHAALASAAPPGSSSAPWGVPPSSSGAGHASASDPGLGQGQRFGQRTASMMIQSALEQARAQGAQGQNRSTAFLRAIASEAATSSSRGLKIAVVVLSVLFALALAGLVALLVISRQETNAVVRETEQLQTQVNQGPAGARIVAAYSSSIYLLVEQSAMGERGMCTAFAVRPDLLATNAHCVMAMEVGQAQGSAYYALPNGGGASRVPIVQMWRHPAYVRGGPHPTEDVGLVAVNGVSTVQVAIAAPGQLQTLSSGDEIYVYGFPGDLADLTSPVATITNGVIGRMVAFDGTAADFARAQLIQHSAFTSPGTSGSPIFNRDGVVVAINAGTFTSAQTQQVVGPTGPHSQTVVTDTGYKYGVRADLLASLIAGLGR